MKRVAPVVLLLFFAAGPAYAQLCAGAPTFRDGPYQVGIGVAVTEGAHGVGGTFASGGESLFGGAGVSILNFSDVDARSTTVSGFAGAELAVDTRNKVFLCPVAQVSFGVGPDIGPIDVSTVGLQGGGTVGIIASESGALMVVPFFGLAAVYQRVTVDFGGAEDSTSDTGGVADLGVGLIVNRNVGITPQISIPFSTFGSDVVFTIRLTLNFGR